MKILVTGVKGQLGYDIVRELELRGYDDVLGIDYEDLDITDEEAVNNYVKGIKPDVIMHNAAYTQVDRAEDEKDVARKVNVLGTKYLVNAAKKNNSKFVYISTDYVFDGTKDGLYEVDDIRNPESVYGLTKSEGEDEVRLLKKHFIVRISWVFGINGNNFVKTMLRLAETRDEINVVSDQIGSPTYTFDLSKLLCDMIETERYGTYHATNNGFCSWYEFAKKIFEYKKTNIKVNPILSKDYGAKAIRPMNSCMSKAKLVSQGFELLPDWQDALLRFMKELEQ